MSKTHTIGEFSRLTGFSTGTLQRWDNIGILKAHRTLTGRRFYTDEDYNKIFNKSNFKVLEDSRLYGCMIVEEI